MDEPAKVTRATRLPFVQVATAIILDPSLSAQARHLYTVLATYADINSREAKLLRSTLAKDIGKSVDTLDRLVKELVKAGIVTVLHQSMNGLHTSSIYSLHDAGLIQSRAVQNAEIAMAASMRPPHPEDTDSDDLSGRMDAASKPQGCGGGGRTGAAGVAAPVRHIKRDLEQETLNESSFADAEAPTSKLNDRPDIAELCDLLADLVQGNDPDGLRPTITKRWRDAARLMLDRDKRDLAKAKGLIRWCQNDDFWLGNVKSMPTFRRQYAQLRDKANLEWKKRQEAEAKVPAHVDHAAPTNIPPPRSDPFAAHRESGIPA